MMLLYCQVENMELKEVRKQFGISQLEAANIVGIPLRTYVRYESDDNYGDRLKRAIIIASIKEACKITESKGLLTVEQIKSKLTDLFDKEYPGLIDFCILFGSYAKGCAKETSDVDLYVSCSLTGLDFVGLIERIRQTLCKKVDLIRSSELNNNIQLTNEIMKGGIKIYG